jgi:hypothetical protein
LSSDSYDIDTGINFLLFLKNTCIYLLSDVVNSSERKQKVVVLRERERATIYTTKMSKQVMKGHVRDAVHMYLVN